jgi:hypothetical protein
VGGLTAQGLSPDQVEHFGKHGWVLLEGVLDADQCQTYVDAIDRSFTYYFDSSPEEKMQVKRLRNTQLLGNVYLDWFKLPGILEANRQLLGVRRPRVSFTVGAITPPHPNRNERREELLDPDLWKWHREFDHPANGLFQRNGDTPPRAAYVGNITFITPASAEDGATAVLDGSHLLEGDYQSLKGQCPIVQAEGPAGSVFMFSETLIHTAVPVVADRSRYVLINHLVMPWMAGDPNLQVPDGWVKHLRDEELRDLFSPPFEGDHGDGPPK